MNKFREIALAIAIVVVLNLFVNYGVYTFYKPANFEKTCPMELTQKNYANKEECEAVGGEWFEGSTAVYQEKYYPVPIGDRSAITSWCDPMAKCQKDYQNKMNYYNRNVFIILEIVGLVSFLLGLFAINAKSVANGFLGGGIISMIIGSIRYWSGMDDYLRFGILGLVLAILVWVGYKKISGRN
jgi:hypothetical protein